MEELRTVWGYIRAVGKHWVVIITSLGLTVVDFVERIFGTWFVFPLWLKLATGISGLIVAQYLAYRDFVKARYQRVTDEQINAIVDNDNLRQAITQFEKEVNRLTTENARILNTERAWIEVELGSPLPPDYRDQGESADVFECSIQIENHGRTIAHVENIQIGADCVSGPFPHEPLNFTTRNLHSILGSGQKETVGGFTANAFLEWRAILDGTKRGVLRITVKYRDVVESSNLHETSAVYVFQNSVEDPPEKELSLSVYT